MGIRKGRKGAVRLLNILVLIICYLAGSTMRADPGGHAWRKVALTLLTGELAEAQARDMLPRAVDEGAPQCAPEPAVEAGARTVAIARLGLCSARS